MSSFGFDPADWPRLSPLLDEALALPAGERAAWLAALPPEHRDLQADLTALLAAEERPAPTLPQLDPDGPDPHRAGQVIGPYRLVRPLGQGGMGSVWLAQRSDGLLQRPVALKLPRAAGSRPELAQRLARERDLLAALSHPNIARLYDAGIDADGQPYLALEVVQGLRIDEHCAARQLDVPARLRLFLQAARAVAHAHSQLIVHRDLKPSNLLVDGQGQVKLLDFGIARLMDEGATQPSDLTRESGRLMTREYASPEQVAGQAAGTASDVYSLGVLLFELLVGARPYRLERDTAAALEEAILRADPPRPSEAATGAERRRALRGDLDTIVLKALKKSPGERYPTVDALADDIQRHLDHRPVLARPDSLGYTLRKLWARHTLALAAAAVAVLALVSGAGLALWQAQQAEAERLRASDVKDFVTALLRDASPYYAGDVGQVTARQLLQQARKRLEAAAPTRPEVRTELDAIVGEALMSFGDLDGAEALVTRAVRQARAELGDEHRETTRARLVQAQVMRLRGRSDALQQELDALLPILRRHAERDPEALVLGLTNVALLANDRGAYAETLRFAEEASALARQRLPDGHPERIATGNLLALAYRFNGRTAEARDVAARSLEQIRLAYGSDPHPRRLEALGIHGRALADLGDLKAGSRQIEAAIEEGTRMYGADHLTVGVLQQNVVAYHLDRGDLDAAEWRSAEALRVVALHTQPDSTTHAVTAMTRGLVLLTRLQPGPALDLLQPAVATLNKTVGPRHDLTLAATAHQVLALTALGTPQPAVEVVASLPERAASAAPHVRLRVALAVAQVRRLQSDPDAALAALQPLLQASAPTPKARHERVRGLVELGWVHRVRGDTAAARASWGEALAEAAQLESLPTPTEAKAQLGLAGLDVAAGRAAAALPRLQQADAVLSRLSADSIWSEQAAGLLRWVRAGLHRDDAAEAQTRATGGGRK